MKLLRVSTVPISLNVLLKGQLKYLAKHYYLIAVSGKGEHLDEVAKREGVKTIEIKMERNISVIKDLHTLFKLFCLFKKEKPDIVHSITPKAGLLSMLAAKIACVPIRMHTFTGLIFTSKKGFLQMLLIKMDQVLCWAATNVYPEGNGVKRDLTNYKITRKPLNILANGNVNGIDLEFFSKTHFLEESNSILRKELGITLTDFVFIFVGRLVKDKGINELISAFSNLNNKSAKLLLVGVFENEIDPLLKTTIDEINSNINIISVGWQSDVRPYLAISDVFVFPSYREGFPNVVMQAGAMGIPCIVTDINGCNEIIIDKENGVIIPPKDEMKLYEAMLSLLDNPKEVKRMAGNSRNIIVDKYDQRLVWHALLKEYRRLENEILKN